MSDAPPMRSRQAAGDFQPAACHKWSEFGVFCLFWVFLFVLFLFCFVFPTLVFIALWRERKGNFSRFQNKQDQSTGWEGEALQEPLKQKLKKKNSAICLPYLRPANEKMCTSIQHLTFLVRSINMYTTP